MAYHGLRCYQSANTDSAMSTYLFLDTNIWIQCRPVEEIDWPAVLGESQVEIIAAPVLIDELDLLKDSDRSPRKRDRARRALHQIEGWDEKGTQIRSGVTARYWHPKVPPDPTALGLDATRKDDVLLATVHVFRADHPHARVVVVSDDTGPRLKGRRLGLELKPPPEDARLPDAPDPLEREVSELKRKLERATNRLPHLLLRFLGGAGGGTRLDVSSLLSAPDTTRDAYVAAALAKARADAPEWKRPENTAPDSSEPSEPTREVRKSVDLADFAEEFQRSPLQGIPAKEIERYTRERERYVAAVAKIAGEQWDADARRRRTVSIVLALHNDGTAPAEDIDVSLHIPDGPEVRADEGEKPDTLQLPRPPRPPQTTEELIGESLRRSLVQPATPMMPPGLDHFFRPASHVPPNVSAPRIRKSDSYDVDFHVRRLKQHHDLRFEPLMLEFPSLRDARSLTLTYRLVSASLPDPETGALHLIVHAAPGQPPDEDPS